MKSEFKNIINDTVWKDALYEFLLEIFHLYPEDKFHHLICSITQEESSDEMIYQKILDKLPTIKPLLSDLTYALPALKKQKKVITSQISEIIQSQTITGYLEIGSTGRYISDLKKHKNVTSIYLTNDVAPSNGIGDLFERSQFSKLGKFIPLNNYDPITGIKEESLEVVFCPIGLHHCPDEKLKNYIQSIHSLLKPNGIFIMRDHDVDNEMMDCFASLIHTVFNLGLKVDWKTNNEEFRHFRSVKDWIEILKISEFKDLNFRILQNNDPSKNTLLAFQKNN